MTTITVKIDSKAHAKQLADLLKNIGYVKEVSVGEAEEALTEEDWVLPGRPATDEEIDKMIDEMDNDTEEYTTEQVLAQIEEWKKKKSA